MCVIAYLLKTPLLAPLRASSSKKVLFVIFTPIIDI